MITNLLVQSKGLKKKLHQQLWKRYDRSPPTCYNLANTALEPLAKVAAFLARATACGEHPTAATFPPN